jgi:hypothetical protein
LKIPKKKNKRNYFDCLERKKDIPSDLSKIAQVCTNARYRHGNEYVGRYDMIPQKTKF